ncbi:MAG TPA: hypothetical protein VGX96_01425 [Candidatus Elarobacter sp.]|jgi:hypothetical protein|nr:hypothetical protein [Candidatus Elarobacter sp.]
MEYRIIRYQAKPERADENQGFIAEVFRELHDAAPDGIGYAVLRLPDDSFVHFVAIENGPEPLTSLPAFKAFQTGIDERRFEPVQADTATLVGSYRMLPKAAPSDPALR